MRCTAAIVINCAGIKQRMSAEPILFWCISSCLFVLAMFIMTLALLRHGAGRQIKNKRLAELMWQAQNSDMDWWLDIK